MISTKNRIGRILEVDNEFVRYQTLYTKQMQIIPRREIVTFQLGRSVYDLWGFEKTVTFWTTDGKKHTIKHLKKKVAEGVVRELEKA